MVRMAMTSACPSRICASAYLFSSTSSASFSKLEAQVHPVVYMHPAHAFGTVTLVATLAVSCRAGDARDAEVVAAVRSAYLLERRVLDAHPALRSRAAVAQIYQEGFSDELAAHLAELSWSEPQRGVRAGGFALEPPSPIVLVDVGNDEATVAFPTPIPQQLLWEEKRYTTATLSRREGRWVITKSVTSEARPPALGPP